MVKNTPFYDKENNLYCNIMWGKGSNPNGPLKKLHNSIYGRLVEVRSGFDFDSELTDSDVVKEIGVFRGSWVDKVYYQDELIMDINTLCPCVVEDYPACL